MSSILKALQRLQSDRSGAGSPDPQPALRDDLALEVTGKPADRKPPASRLPRPRALLAAAGALALLVAAGTIGWWLTRSATTPALVAARAAAPAPSAGTPAAPDEPPRPSAPPAAVPPTPREAPVAAPEAAPAPAFARPQVAAAPAPAPSPEAQASAPSGPQEEPHFEIVGAAAPPPAPPTPEPRASIARAAPSAASVAPLPPTVAPERSAPRERVPDVATVPPPPEVEVLRTVWHPNPERRHARVRVAGLAEPVDLREGDVVSTLVVKTIEPSGVIFLHGGRELRRTVGNRP
jgi:hypothetical protein